MSSGGCFSYLFIYLSFLQLYLLDMTRDFFFLLPPFSVACGMGHSMVIVDRTNAGDRLDQVIIQKSITILYWNFKVLFA